MFLSLFLSQVKAFRSGSWVVKGEMYGEQEKRKKWIVD